MGKKKDEQGMSFGRTVLLALQYWRPHWRLALLLLVMLGTQQAFKAFFAYSQRLIVDKGLLAKDGAMLAQVVIMLAAGFLLSCVAALAADYLSARVGAAIINTVRYRMFCHLQDLSIGFYSKSESGDIVARFTSDLGDIQKGLTTRIIDAFLALIGMCINIPMAFALEWRLATLMVLGMPLVGVGTRLFGKRAAAARYALKQAEAGVAATVQENVRAQPVVKVFGLAGFARQRFTEQIGQVGRKHVRSDFVAEVVGSASSLGVLAVQVSVIAYGAHLAFAGSLSPGTLVAFLALHAVISKDAYDLTKKVIPNLISSSGGLQRIEELLAEPVQISSRPGAPAVPRVQGPIRLEEVSFSYPDGRQALENVSLEIPPGSQVALVGPSGSGKSTVLQLLLRFYDPQKGRITLDGRDLREVDLDSVHAQMAAVFQESFLFSGSVRDNIQMGRRSASEAEIVAAARAAEIHDLILSQPDGYQTAVGEMGGRLSGGQRQRLAIARAMLRNPAVLILDEATSALDPATESAINATIDRLAEGRIVVSVTHRLSSARGASRIFVMNEGRLLETGSHEDLMARKGLYRQLWDKQSGVEVSVEGDKALVKPELLRQVPLFVDLDETALRQVAASMVSEQAGANSVIFWEGQQGDRFFVIARGKVEILAAVGQLQRRLAVLSDGDFFGEMAGLAETPRRATVRTLTPCLLLSLDLAAFGDLLWDHPSVRQAIEKTAISRGLAGFDLTRLGGSRSDDRKTFRVPALASVGSSKAAPSPTAAPSAPAQTIYTEIPRPGELAVEQGVLPSVSFPIGLNTRIGRAPDNDVVIPDTQVSQHHAALVASGMLLMLTDLDSTNGTFLNGSPVKHPVPVEVGDAIDIGATRLRVR